VDLEHLAVVAEQAVQLVLDVAELGVDGCAETVRDGGRELVVETDEPPGELVGRCAP
jgi:hypothetical protein